MSEDAQIPRKRPLPDIAETVKTVGLELQWHQALATHSADEAELQAIRIDLYRICSRLREIAAARG